MMKNITRTIERMNYNVTFVDMDTMQIQTMNVYIYDLIDSKNIQAAIMEEIKEQYANVTYLKHELISKKKYKCSMPVDFYIEHSEHTEVE